MIVATVLAGGSLALYAGSGQSGAPVAAAEPPRDVDRDGDGVPDELDQCVDLAGLTPDGCPPRDSDGDGVINRADGCWDAPGPRANRGCPDTDQDRDGVADRNDRCRDVPGLARFAGCRPPDGDGDGIADPDDKCPDSAEVWNGRRDTDGCRDRGAALVRITGTRAIEMTGSLFDSSGDLERRGRKALKAASMYAAAIGGFSARVVIERRTKKRPGKQSDRRARKEARRAARRARMVTEKLRARRSALTVDIEERAGERERVTVEFQ